jgi:hypothetical protein
VGRFSGSVTESVEDAVSLGDVSGDCSLVTGSSVELLPLDDSVCELDEVVEHEEVGRPAVVAGLSCAVRFDASNAVAANTITRMPIP